MCCSSKWIDTHVHKVSEGQSNKNTRPASSFVPTAPQVDVKRRAMSAKADNEHMRRRARTARAKGLSCQLYS